MGEIDRGQEQRVQGVGQDFEGVGSPVFRLFADGKEVDRYTGSDRMTLMNKVLAFQRANGVKMPQRERRRE